MCSKIETPDTGSNRELGEVWSLMDLEGITTSLQETQNGTGNAASAIGDAVTEALSDIENAIQDAASRFNQTAQSLLALIKTVNKAGDECVVTATPLDNATLGFQADMVDCLEADMQMAIELGERAVQIQYNVNQLKRNTQHTLYLCTSSNAVSNGICWMQNLPALISE